MTDIDIDAVEARAEQAIDDVPRQDVAVHSTSNSGYQIMTDDIRVASLLSAAPTMVPALVAALRDRDATIARVRDEHTRRADNRLSWCSGCGRAWPCPTLAALDAQVRP